MRFERERWTPLTVTIETREEAEVLHKILAMVDGTDCVEDVDIYGLFMKLGEGLGAIDKYHIEGDLRIHKKA